MFHRLLAVACLLLASGSAYADPQSTYQWMLTQQIVASAQSQGGVATVIVGAHFFNGNFASQQGLCGTLLQYLQSQDSGVQQFALVDSYGNPVGTYSAGSLTLTNH